MTPRRRVGRAKASALGFRAGDPHHVFITSDGPRSRPFADFQSKPLSKESEAETEWVSGEPFSQFKPGFARVGQVSNLRRIFNPLRPAFTQNSLTTVSMTPARRVGRAKASALGFRAGDPHHVFITSDGPRSRPMMVYQRCSENNFADFQSKPLSKESEAQTEWVSGEPFSQFKPGFARVGQVSNLRRIFNPLRPAFTQNSLTTVSMTPARRVGRAKASALGFRAGDPHHVFITSDGPRSRPMTVYQRCSENNFADFQSRPLSKESEAQTEWVSGEPFSQFKPGFARVGQVSNLRRIFNPPRPAFTQNSLTTVSMIPARRVGRAKASALDFRAGDPHHVFITSDGPRSRPFADFQSKPLSKESEAQTEWVSGEPFSQFTPGFARVGQVSNLRRIFNPPRPLSRRTR